MKEATTSQEMVIKGVLGTCDGVKVVKVASSRLPAGCAFIMTHPDAATAPKRLWEYKTHEDPVGYSGWVCEGRYLYDCFVLNEKANAVYYHGSQAVLQVINVTTAATDTGKSTILIEPAAHNTNGTAWYYQTKADASTLDTVTYGTAITTANWTALSGTGVEITPTSTHTVVAVVEVDSSAKPIGYGTAVLNIG